MSIISRALVCLVVLSLPVFPATSQPWDEPSSIFSPYISAKSAVSIYEARTLDQGSDLLKSYSESAVEEIVAEVGELVDRHRLHAAEGALDESGCFLTNASPWEDAYANPLNQPTNISDLVCNAPDVLLVRISDKSPVMYRGGLMLTRYEALALDDWSLTSREISEAIEFFDRAYVLKVGGLDLCVRRRGVTTPESGQVWMLIGRLNEQEGRFDVGNFFRVEGDEVHSQGYPFLSAEGDSLERLKAARAQKRCRR